MSWFRKRKTKALSIAVNIDTSKIQQSIDELKGQVAKAKQTDGKHAVLTVVAGQPPVLDMDGEHLAISHLSYYYDTVNYSGVVGGMNAITATVTYPNGQAKQLVIDCNKPNPTVVVASPYHA